MNTHIGIHFIIATFIWLVSWTAAIDIPYEDLNNPNKLCPQSSCSGVDPKMAATVMDVDNSDRLPNCLCDDHCGEYGDCCTDSPHFDPVEQHGVAARYSCVLIEGGGGAYAMAKCPVGWPDADVRAACETPLYDNDENGMLGNPVTSRSTGRSYRNRFCAVCNGDGDHPTVWNTKLVCEDLLDVAVEAEQAVLDTLRYGEDQRWSVVYRNRTYRCEPVTVAPANARACLPNAVMSCHPKWPNDEIRSNCEAYTTVMYNGAQAYKNIHCAMCNHVPVQNVTCENAEVHSRFPNAFAARSFTALFVARPGHRKCRGSDTYYDPFAKTCRPLVPVGGVPLNCSTIAMYTVAPRDWRPSETVEYVTLDNGTMAMCVDAAETEPPAAEALKSVAFTYVGLGVSVVFLIVHLAVFAALPELKNLSGKNLASFCVSLVFSYAAFVAGNWLTGSACYAGAVFTYYSFLTSFAWMLIMSFDCWRSLRLATVELRVTTGRQTKKFLVYSAVCWLVPAMLTFVAVAADVMPGVPADVRPRFGADQCWFGSKTALLVFFASPLTAIMSVNFALFVWTAYMIHSSRATIRHVNTRHVRRDFRMYCRLAVLMGLTWTTGIFASYTDSKYLWILFVVLNTFQGLFVFVAFTCRRRILNSLVGGGGGHHRPSADPEKNSGKNARDPPPSSFSWSSAENSTVPVSLEKTSETLY